MRRKIQWQENVVWLKNGRKEWMTNQSHGQALAKIHAINIQKENSEQTEARRGRRNDWNRNWQHIEQQI